MTVAFDFRDKVALITGASKGIGRAIAEDFLDAGAKVIVCARGKKELAKFQSTRKKEHLLTISADITKEDEVRRVVQRGGKIFGKIDILVNNVGGALKFGDLWNISIEDWKRAFDLNLLSMVTFSKETIPWLKRAPSPRIINISSISGVAPGLYNPHYTTMKAGTINFSKYLANSLAPDRILVNCVCPGSIETDSWRKSLVQIAEERGLPLGEITKELTEKENIKIPLGKMGSGKDVAQLVLFLASEQANWITGSCFHLNGGKLQSIA